MDDMEEARTNVSDWRAATLIAQREVSRLRKELREARDWLQDCRSELQVAEAAVKELHLAEPVVVQPMMRQITPAAMRGGLARRLRGVPQ